MGMDYGDAFMALTQGMEEFKIPLAKKRKRTATESNDEQCNYHRLANDCTKEFLQKPAHIGNSRFPPVVFFEDLVKAPYNYPRDTADVVKSLGYQKPMPIQSEVIPLFHEGHNMLIGSPTGSGKTAAYLLPLLNAAANVSSGASQQEDKHSVHPYCIILSTTQELLGQIWAEAVRLGQNQFPKNGKISILRRHHYAQLMKQKPESEGKSKQGRKMRLSSETKLVITTPKRLSTLLSKTGKQCPIKFDRLRWLVIDECDKMLEANIGSGSAANLRDFRSQLTAVLTAIRGSAAAPPGVALFSATLPPSAVTWAAEQLAVDPAATPSRGLVKLTLGDCNSAVSVVKQELRYCGTEQGKLLELRRLLVEGLVCPCLIFTESRQRAAELFREILLSDKHTLVSILSSDKSEAQRLATVKAFREGKLNVLVCTDLLGRGMDFRSLMMVINYDLPPSPIEYIHRVGRTGRAGRLGGRAVTLWTDADLPHMDAILDVMARGGVEVDPELRRLVGAWKVRKAKQMHAKGLAGVVSKRKGERKLAAKVVASRKEKSKGEFNKERSLLRPWNPHRGSIADVPGAKLRDIKISQTEDAGPSAAKRRKVKTKKNKKTH